MLKTILKRIKRLVCQALDHDWPTHQGAFHIPHKHCLVFCKRCGEEFYGRTLADLRAIPEHELEEPVASYLDWSED